MLRTLLLASILLLTTLSASTLPASPAMHRSTAAAVFVCMSKSSVAYHSSSSCAGLNRCTHEVRSMSASAAQELGKRACHKCY